jgi:hypothetical protein
MKTNTEIFTEWFNDPVSTAQTIYRNVECEYAARLGFDVGIAAERKAILEMLRKELDDSPMIIRTHGLNRAIKIIEEMK